MYINLEESQEEVKTSRSDISGWMLKKKRKKMQGTYWLI